MIAQQACRAIGCLWAVNHRTDGCCLCRASGDEDDLFSCQYISDAKGDALSIIKLNIDENPLTPQQYNVRGIPTLLIFKGGEVVAEKIGAVPKSHLEAWINDTIS